MASLSQSLTNMSVSADNSGGNAGLLMPKLQYRYRLVFSNFGVSSESAVLTRQVVDVTRPSLTFTEIPIDVYNSKLYIAGKHEWAPITVNLRDDASNQVATLVGQQLQSQLDFVEQASAASGLDYKFGMEIQILDGGNGASAPGPVVIETWSLGGCFIQAANYNNLNYGASEVVTISLTIRYDNALQVAGNPSSSDLGSVLGQAVARGAVAGSVVTGLGSPSL
jgi:hypothetical protein